MLEDIVPRRLEQLPELAHNLFVFMIRFSSVFVPVELEAAFGRKTL